MRRCVFTATVGASVFVVAAAQQSTDRQTFRSGREVLGITTAVHDGSGKAVADLQPSDFTVRIDGQLRRVLTARLYGHGSTPPTSALLPVASAVANVDRPAGRAVVIAVDRDSIRAGSERALLETAAKMLDTLAPEDAAAAASLPGAITDLTRDRAPVAAAIRGMTGTEPRSAGLYHVTVGEAFSIEHRDGIVLDAVISRECSERKLCPGDIRTQSHDMVLQARFHAENVLHAVTSIIDRFGTIRAPKHLVLISAGLALDQELLGRYTDLADKAARSHVSLFVVQLDQSAFDASSSRGGAQSYGGQMAEGLGPIASLTGGQYFHGVSTAAGVFDRIASDINSFYELGVESGPEDADGKAHKVDVKVARTGVTVSAPAATAAPARKALTPVDRLKSALAEPTDVADLPLEVATYVTHSADPHKVRVIVAAASPNAAQPAPTLWGSLVMDGNKVVGAVGANVAPDAASPWSSTGIVEMVPGKYRLRTAIVGGERLGTLELPLSAGLRAMGDARASDLIVGTIENGRLEPRPHLAAGEKAVAMLELSADTPLEALAGELVLVPAGSDTPAARQPLAFRPRNDDKGIVLGEARLDLTSVAPGRYVVSAIVEQGGKAVGRVSRALDVTR